MAYNGGAWRRLPSTMPKLKTTVKAAFAKHFVVRRSLVVI